MKSLNLYGSNDDIKTIVYNSSEVNKFLDAVTENVYDMFNNLEYGDLSKINIRENIVVNDKKNFTKDGIVIMCGDGINDSISLVTADIGVSISSGTDIAMDSASVILMNDNIEKINELIEISEKTIKNIKQNLFWAFFYNCLMIPVAIGLLKPFGISINPMIASLAMVFSSFTVILNALRLRRSFRAGR